MKETIEERIQDIINDMILSMRKCDELKSKNASIGNYLIADEYKQKSEIYKSIAKRLNKLL